jgi:outer membrane biosynthesis protein TonB
MTSLAAPDGFEMTRSMKVSLAGSVIFHVSVIILGTVGLPYIAKPPLLPPQPISVEVVDVSEMTTTNKKPQLQPVPEKKEEPKPSKKVEAPPKVEAKAPPKVKPLEKPPEVKKDTVKPEPKVPPPPKEKLEKAEEPPKPKEPEEKKEEAVQQEDDFMSVLKNLQDGAAVAEESPDAKEVVEQEMSPLAKFSERLSTSELDAIARALNAQFASCWNLMAGARNAEDITVSITLKVNPDRTVQSARITDQWRYNQDSFYRAAADTALRAIRHPNCEVLDLPPDKYSLWKDLKFNFNPSAAL